MLYKWPQGRIIRIISFLLVTAIAADLFFSPGGAWGHLTVGSEIKTQLYMGIFFAVLSFSALAAGILLIGFKPFSVDFLIEVEQEMVKVEWPTTSVLVRSTIVIAIATVILGALIYGVDFLNLNLFLNWLPALFHRLSA